MSSKHHKELIIIDKKQLSVVPSIDKNIDIDQEFNNTDNTDITSSKAKIHLNVRTSYSILSSLITLDNYFKYAKDHKLNYLSICDNNMYGVYSFYERCLINNITPLIGLNFYTLFQNKRYNLNIFAINKQGYYQLVLISSWIMTNNEINSIPFDDLKQFLDINLKIIINYDKDNYNAALYQQIISLYKNDNNIYLGLNYNNISLLSFLIELEKNSSHIIWNNKVLYFSSSEFNVYKIINSIKKQIKFIKNKIIDNYRIDNIILEYEHYLDNNFTFVKDFVKYDLKVIKINDNLLKYPIPKNISSSYEFLLGICKKGLEYRFGKNVKKEYIDRLNYELGVINSIGFNDYFLIVWDYVNYAKENNIYVGPGRGSAAGSLVSYLLDITTIDPIEYNLLFERFLNPERISLPDIDIDFEDDKREQIVDYLLKKYGKDHIAHIITFQTIGLKMALRDISRVFDVPLDELDKMSNSIEDNNNNNNFDNIFTNNKVLKFYKNKYPHVFLYLPNLIGLPRQTGTHSAGIVLSQTNLSKVLPIRKGYNGGIYQTQYSMNYLEVLGLVKMDILGLRNLTIIHDIVNNINQTQKKINIDKIPLNDAKTFSILAQGETEGIFQLESSGMKKILIDMKPLKFEDIVTTSSLYRPGPQENISLFIKRKNEGGYKIIDDRLKDILCSTYGIIVYQEQVMLIAQKVANFSLAKADILRLAMGKKDIKIMNKLKPEFIQNAINNQYKIQIVEEIWELIYKFALYGFNRSHAVAYSLIGYQMAYLKANYPKQFLVSLLNSVIGYIKKTNDYLQLAHNLSLEIIAPTINQPLSKYLLKDNKIYLPILIIKQIGLAFYNKILEDFIKNGKYHDIYDLFIRLYKKGLNKKTYEALCYSNTLSEFQINRTTLIKNYTAINAYVKKLKVNEKKSELRKSKLIKKPELIYYEDNLIKLLIKEYYFLGFYLSIKKIQPLLLK